MKRILVLLFVTFCALQNALAQKSFTPGNLAVLRYGDLDVTVEKQAISLPVYLDEYNTEGKLVNSVRIKGVVGAGSAERIFEGSVALSPDNSKLSFLAYKTSADENSVSMKDAREVNRVVVTIGEDFKSLNTSTVLDNVNGNTRTVVVNGNDCWMIGNVDGVQYAEFGKKGSAIQISPRPSSARAMRIFNGDLYFSTNAGSGVNGAVRIQKISDLPKVATKPEPLPGFGKEGNPYDFVLFDVNSKIDGPDLMYVVDDSTPSKLYKYVFDGSTWQPKGEIENTDGTRKVLKGLTGTLVAGKPTLYASTTTSIIRFVDNSTYTADANFEVKVVVNKKTGTKEVFKGISFVPGTKVINTIK